MINMHIWIIISLILMELHISYTTYDIASGKR